MSLLNLVSYDSEPEDEANSHESGVECKQTLKVEEDSMKIKDIPTQFPKLQPSHDSHLSTDLAETFSVEKKIAERSRLQELPPSSLEIPNSVTLQTIKQYLELKEISGFDLMENIRSNKNFGNPYIFMKVSEYFKIDEIGSNYPATLFDPHGYRSSDFEENIKKRYSNAVPAASSSSSVAFVSSQVTSIAPAAKKSPAVAMKNTDSVGVSSSIAVPSVSSAVEDDPSRRKRSRWDKDAFLPGSLSAINLVGGALAATAQKSGKNSAGGATAGTYIG